MSYGYFAPQELAFKARCLGALADLAWIRFLVADLRCGLTSKYSDDQPRDEQGRWTPGEVKPEDAGAALPRNDSRVMSDADPFNPAVPGARYAANEPNRLPAQVAEPSGARGVAEPVPFVDRNGSPILDIRGGAMQRPAGLEPVLFARAGQRVTDYARIDPELSVSALAVDLAKFKQNGPWDAQRIGGGFHREFVDYSTVAIGIYASKAGLSLDSILSIENGYASLFSNFGSAERDPVHTSLRKENVFNTKLGFELVRSGRISD